MRRFGVVPVVLAGATAIALAGCGSADPPAAAAVGLGESGYFGVIRMCDEGRTLTYVEISEPGAEPTIGWIGRTVEPITFYRIGEDPPDNWVIDVDGGLLSDVTYRFEAEGNDIAIVGPEFTLADLNTLEIDEVIDSDGVVHTVDEFLDTACFA